MPVAGTRQARAAARGRRGTAARSRTRRNGWTKDPGGRRDRIFAAATRLFAARGIAATRTSEIAAAAGVAEGTLFHHFGSKEGLLAAIAESYGAGFIDAMFRGISVDDGLPSVDTVIRRGFAYVRDSDRLFGVFLLADEAAGAQLARRANRAAIVARLATIFAEWRARRWIRPLDPIIAAELCFGLVESALKACFVGRPVDAVEDYTREAVRCIETMLLPPS